MTLRKDSKDMRNAQNLASVCAAAQAAGLDFTNADLNVTISAIVSGATITEAGNPFDGTFFGVPGLAADDISAAEKYLTITGVAGDEVLQYDAP